MERTSTKNIYFSIKKIYDFTNNRLPPNNTKIINYFKQPAAALAPNQTAATPEPIAQAAGPEIAAAVISPPKAVV